MARSAAAAAGYPAAAGRCMASPAQARWPQVCQLCIWCLMSLNSFLTALCGWQEWWWWWRCRDDTVSVPAGTAESGESGADKGRGPRIYVGGIPTAVSETMVRNHFSQWGQVSCHLSHKLEQVHQHGTSFKRFLCAPSAHSGLIDRHSFVTLGEMCLASGACRHCKHS